MKTSDFKAALFAIALSPFILNAELREDLADAYDDEDYVTYTDDREDENDDGLYYDDDAEDNLADASYSNDSYSGRQNSDTGCNSPYHRMHFGVRHTEARGVGYHDGYTTLEGFGIYDHNPNFMPFLDLRGHVFNNGKLAGNIGIGERTVLSSINHILGAYLYYDVRQENHSFTVSQLSPGIELLGKRMEYRMNGYFPVGGNHSHKYGYEFNRFDGNNIRLRQKQKFAMKGGDAEVGAHLTQSTKYDVYAGAGPYYFSAGGAHGWGGKVRLLGRYKEYISLEASYSYDRMFRNVIQGTVGFNYAFGKKLTRKDRNCPQQNDLMLSRAAFAPYRFEIPVVKKIRKNVRAINPATGSPWQVWFVDNTSSSAGTYQSPYPTLAQAESASSANDMIYVFPGNGTSTGMDMGITLKDGQKLFGSSVAHKINTTKGKIVIPTFSKTAPTITNTASVVTLANGNEVSGMNITVSTPGIIAIDGASGINGAIIDRNTISGNVNYNGIMLNARGSLSIIENTLAGVPSNVADYYGIYTGVVRNQSLTATVSKNIVSGYVYDILLTPETGFTSLASEVLISENVLSNFTYCGIFYGTGIPDATIRIEGNTIFNVDASTARGPNPGGITVSVNQNAPNSGKTLILNNNISSTSTNPNVNGILSQMNLPNNGTTKTSIHNNNVQTSLGSGSVGINVRTTNGAFGEICASITNNEVTVQAASTNGISIAAPLGAINIDDFSNNIAPAINVSGNVNLVAPRTCNQ